MNPFWTFVHFLGFTMWLGGGLAAMMMAIATRGEERARQGTIARVSAAIYGRVIAPGAALVIISGLFLTMTYMGARNRGEGAEGMESEPSVWLFVMQGAGLLGAALVIAAALPATSKVAHLDPVTQAEAFDAARAKQRVIGMIATTLGMLSLVAGAMLG